MRQPEGKAVLRYRVRRRHQPPDDRVATLAVQHFARLQVFLGDGHGIGAPAGRAAGRLAAQADRRDRDPDFQADQVPALVHARVAARRVGLHAVLLEAAADVVRLALEYDPHAETDVVRDWG